MSGHNNTTTWPNKGFDFARAHLPWPCTSFHGLRAHTNTHIHTLKYTYTHIHSHTHMHTQTLTHTYTPYTHSDKTHIHIHTHIHTLTYTYTPTHSHTHTLIHIHTHSHIHSHTHTCIDLLCRLFELNRELGVGALNHRSGLQHTLAHSLCACTFKPAQIHIVCMCVCFRTQTN